MFASHEEPSEFLAQPLQLSSLELFEIFNDPRFASFAERRLECDEPGTPPPPPFPATPAELVRTNNQPRHTSKQQCLSLPQIAPKLSGIRRTRAKKVVWTQTLQRRFLKALDMLGPVKALPGEILHVMNVADLRRSNVSAHLQKHRIKLQKNLSTAAELCPPDEEPCFGEEARNFLAVNCNPVLYFEPQRI